MGVLSWQVQVWSLPDDPEGFRLLDVPPVLAASTMDRDDAVGSGRITVPADYEGLGRIIAVDPSDVGSSKASLVSFWREGATKPDFEFFAEEMTEILSDRDPIALIKGSDVRSGPDDAVVYPLSDLVRDWIWGGRNALPPLSLVDLQNINETWELHSFSDPFALTVNGQATSSLSNPSASDVEAALQGLTGIEDVTVAGTGADADNPMTIIFYNPADPTTVTVSTGTGTLTKIVEGALSPAPVTISEYADKRVDPLVHGTYDDPAIEVDTTTVNTGSSWSVLVNALTRFAGSQILVPVTPGQTYQVSVSVRPDTTSQFGLRVRDPLDDGDENPIAGVNATLTANTWTEMSLEVTIPPGVTTVIMRVAVIDGTPANIDDFRVDWEGAEFAEGMARTTYGDIVGQLNTAARARGSLTWLKDGFTAEKDSNGDDWDVDDLSWRVDVGEKHGTHVLGDGKAAGYDYDVVRLDTIEGTYTHELLLFNPGSRGDTSSQAIVMGAFRGGRLAKRRPPYTHLLVEDDQGLTTEVTDSDFSGLTRRESFLRAEYAPDAVTAAKVGEATFAQEVSDLLATQVRLREDTVVPYQDFDVSWTVPYDLGSRAAHHDRTVHMITLDLTDGRWEAEVTASRLYPSDGSSGGAAMWEAIRRLYAEFARRRRPRPAGPASFGGGGGMAHILVVSDSEPQSVQSKADFVVPSSNSSTALQAAFDTVPDGSGGRWSIWMAGRFDLDADVTAPSGAWLRGLGSSFSGLPPI